MTTSSLSALGVTSFTPDHIPPELVRPFHFVDAPGMSRCPFSTVAQLHAGPRIFWNPANHRLGGSWVLTHADDIKYVLENTEHFSCQGQSGLSQLMNESWGLLPLEVDPPQHAPFRRLINPPLSPAAIHKLLDGITQRAIELIEAVRPQGSCEFMLAFGQPFPVSIFMQLMGLPVEHTDTFLRWEMDLLHGTSLDQRRSAAFEIRDYLKRFAAERRAQPTGDMTSAIVTGTVEGRPLSDDEILGVMYLMFVGGLDTVASTLGFMFQHLAEHPEQQQALRDHPASIDASVEEFLRRFSVVTSHRRCKVDVELAGVRMKAGDWITINSALGSLDAAKHPDPLTVDFDRKATRHYAFNVGPHVCAGMHLARREIIIALREWLARIPQWRIKPGTEPRSHGGGVFGVDRLELEW